MPTIQTTHRCGVSARVAAFAMLALAGLAVRAVPVAEPPATPPAIAITPSDGFNLAVVDQANDHYVVVQLTTPAHNWFAGLFTSLPTDAPTTIGLSMDGNNTRGNSANVSKWRGLVPVMTYADPTQYESYECYEKDKDGIWRSTDPLKPQAEREAGKGKCPVQTAIPEELAHEFLSKDGKSWEPWREVEKAEAVPALNVFRIRHHFKRPSATVAMRVPYTYTYLQQVTERLLAAELPDVSVDDLGVTAGGRRIQVIRFAAREARLAGWARRSVVMIAREHATEHASSWAVHGAMQALISQTQSSDRRRDAYTWMLIPILDPDGAAESVFERFTDRFSSRGHETAPPDVIGYARYFSTYVNQGGILDAAITFHNVEANEGPNLFPPITNNRRIAETRGVNRLLLSRLGAQAYAVPAFDKPTDLGFQNARLYGWCAMQFGALDLAYEVNDRLPGRQLSLARLARMGDLTMSATQEWLDSEDGRAWHERVIACLDARQTSRSVYYSRVKRFPSQRTDVETLAYGY